MKRQYAGTKSRVIFPAENDAPLPGIGLPMLRSQLLLPAQILRLCLFLSSP